MTVFFNRARGRWHYDFVVGGVRHAGQARDPATGAPARTKGEAKAIEEALRVAARAAAVAPAPPAPAAYTLAMAIAAWSVAKRGRDNWANNAVYAREILAHFGPATPVAAIDAAAVRAYVAWASAQPVRVWAGGTRRPRPEDADDPALWRAAGRTRAPATVNRYLNVLRESLRMAHEARDGAGRRLLPVLPRVPELAEPAAAPRPIPDEALARIVAVAAPHLADAILLARNMGFRLDEMTSIRPDQVDDAARGVWLDAAQTKAARGTFKPAPAAAWAVLERRAAEARALGLDRILFWPRPAGRAPDGSPRARWEPVRSFKTAWRGALARAGLAGRWRWHDLKASFVTAVARHGRPATVQQLAEHRHASTTARYLAVFDEDKRAAVEAAQWSPTGPTPNPESQSPRRGKARIARKCLEKMVGPARFELATPRPPDRSVAPETSEILAFLRRKRA
ncbi:MAG: tyrosine-type recombinase/integrase [Phenylobacterium sp.]|uniref:tyrosine-type recombinase/integrase n=1 Tax=Phenylobacterium sp. TaxID=1871053 RepID=UPI0025F12F84|nr:tyrosine-type recombinase/integrase [Phenylobacterium sp.]MCA6303678.1 tyrosine-type recombinase/integrase [Phenylobacterium sp.]